MKNCMSVSKYFKEIWQTKIISNISNLKSHKYDFLMAVFYLFLIFFFSTKCLQIFLKEIQTLIWNQKCFFNDDSAQFLMSVLIQCGRRKKISGLFIAYLPQSQIKYFLRNILCVFIEKNKAALCLCNISQHRNRKKTIRKVKYLDRLS